MAISDQIERLQGIKEVLRTALVGLGLAASEADLEACAQAVADLPNRGAVQGSIAAADAPYAVPAGYHNGEGTVGIAGAEKEKLTPGNIKKGVVLLGVAGSYEGEPPQLQTKQVTPTKSQQQVTADEGYEALSAVTVLAIPVAYQDVTAVTAAAGDVLAGKIIVDKAGAKVTGTMPDNGAVARTLDAKTTSYTIPAGKHSGSGTVKIVPESKTVTPTKAQQTAAPTSGKVLTSVVVAAIPDKYQDVTGVTAAAADVLDGKVIVAADGAAVEGAMPNNGTLTKTMTGLTDAAARVSIPKGYTAGGTVSLTDDIETALAAL